jgi:hypothetical protein
MPKSEQKKVWRTVKKLFMWNVSCSRVADIAVPA